MSARAFTLLEVGIALVLLSLMIAVAVPAFGALTGAQMREQAGAIGGAVRDTYARTALLGRSTRIVFDLEQQAWWIEESPQVVRLKGLKKGEKIELDRAGKAKLDPLDERLENIEADTTDDKERAKLELLSPPPFQPAAGDDGKPHKLSGDVHIKSVWVEHLDEKATGGQVGLYFFPGGSTEEAHIVLTDDEEGRDTMTVVVASLTGDVQIELEEPREPTADDEEVD